MGIYPIGSGSTRLEKYANTIMLTPVASAICMCGDFSKVL